MNTTTVGENTAKGRDSFSVLTRIFNGIRIFIFFPDFGFGFAPDFRVCFFPAVVHSNLWETRVRHFEGWMKKIVRVVFFSPWHANFSTLHARDLQEGHFSRCRWGGVSLTPPKNTDHPLPCLPRVSGGQFFRSLGKCQKNSWALRNLHTYPVVLSTRKGRNHLVLISFHFSRIFFVKENFQHCMLRKKI